MNRPVAIAALILILGGCNLLHSDGLISVTPNSLTLSSANPAAVLLVSNEGTGRLDVALARQQQFRSCNGPTQPRAAW